MSFSSVQASIAVVSSLKVWIQRTDSARRTRDKTRTGNPWLPPLLSLIGAQIPRAKNLNGTKFWSQKISLPIARAPSSLISPFSFSFFCFSLFAFFFALAPLSERLDSLHPNNKLEVNRILIKDKTKFYLRRFEVTKAWQCHPYLTLTEFKRLSLCTPRSLTASFRTRYFTENTFTEGIFAILINDDNNNNNNNISLEL